jgi:hypothetical protein
MIKMENKLEKCLRHASLIGKLEMISQLIINKKN